MSTKESNVCEYELNVPVTLKKAQGRDTTRVVGNCIRASSLSSVFEHLDTGNDRSERVGRLCSEKLRSISGVSVDKLDYRM